MEHDASPDCPDGEFIMSALRQKPSLSWSLCSNNVAKDLVDKDCLYDKVKDNDLAEKYPGQRYNATQQCQIFLL